MCAARVACYLPVLVFGQRHYHALLLHETEQIIVFCLTAIADVNVVRITDSRLLLDKVLDFGLQSTRVSMNDARDGALRA